MANHKSAEKRIRQTAKRAERNRHFRTRMRNALKKIRAAIHEEDASTAKELLVPTLGLIDSTAQKGVIHHNAAARYKSRLTRQVTALG